MAYICFSMAPNDAIEYLKHHAQSRHTDFYHRDRRGRYALADAWWFDSAYDLQKFWEEMNRAIPTKTAIWFPAVPHDQWDDQQHMYSCSLWEAPTISKEQAETFQETLDKQSHVIENGIKYFGPRP